MLPVRELTCVSSVVLGAWMSAYAFNIMGDVSFVLASGNTESLREAWEIHIKTQEMEQGGYFAAEAVRTNVYGPTSRVEAIEMGLVQPNSEGQ